MSGRFYFLGKKEGSSVAGAKPLVLRASSPQISTVAPESVPFLLGFILTEARHCKTHRSSHIISFPHPQSLHLQLCIPNPQCGVNLKSRRETSTQRILSPKDLNKTSPFSGLARAAAYFTHPVLQLGRENGVCTDPLIVRNRSFRWKLQADLMLG